MEQGYKEREKCRLGSRGCVVGERNGKAEAAGGDGWMQRWPLFLPCYKVKWKSVSVTVVLAVWGAESNTLSKVCSMVAREFTQFP